MIHNICWETGAAIFYAFVLASLLIQGVIVTTLEPATRWVSWLRQGETRRRGLWDVTKGKRQDERIAE